jgi:LDH2 family malate/lactate/ureidoglycolate dehydrogenase
VSTATYAASALRGFGAEVLEAEGLPQADARTVANALVHADLRGVGSHGMTRLPIYVERLQAGIVNPRPNLRVEQSRGGAVLIDADNGMGAPVTANAIRVGLDLLTEHAAVTIGIRGCNHYGAGAYFAEQATAADAAIHLYSNAPPTMAPWGGVDPYFGTNPYTFGVPAATYPPVILDMASSVVARGKIIAASQRGDDIPSGWAIDQAGNDTTDAEAALRGSVLPFGGPKGSGIAMMADVMAGVMTGAAFGRDIGDLYTEMTRPQNTGVSIQLLDVGVFHPVEVFKRRMDRMIDEIKAVRARPGSGEVVVPGEIEARTARQREVSGVPLDADVVERLQETAERHGISLPASLDVTSYSSEART